MEVNNKNAFINKNQYTREFTYDTKNEIRIRRLRKSYSHQKENQEESNISKNKENVMILYETKRLSMEKKNEINEENESNLPIFNVKVERPLKNYESIENSTIFRKNYIDDMIKETSEFDLSFKSFVKELFERVNSCVVKKKKQNIPKLQFNKKIIDLDQKMRYPQDRIMVNFQRLQFDILLIHNQNYEQSIFKNENLNNKSALLCYYFRKSIRILLQNINESFNPDKFQKNEVLILSNHLRKFFLSKIEEFNELDNKIKISRLNFQKILKLNSKISQEFNKNELDLIYKSELEKLKKNSIFPNKINSVSYEKDQIKELMINRENYIHIQLRRSSKYKEIIENNAVKNSDLKLKYINFVKMKKEEEDIQNEMYKIMSDNSVFLMSSITVLSDFLNK